MNNKVLYLIIGVVVIGVIGFVVFNSSAFMGQSRVDDSLSSDLSTKANDTNTEMNTTENNSEMDASLSQNGRYQVYSERGYQEVADKTRVLFFYASWCPTCIPADAEFSENADQIPDDVVIFRVNYKDSDTEPFEEELAREYGVNYKHTFVQLDENGEEVAKWNGGAIEELLQNIES